jgi:hypothetical protein
MIRLRVLDEEEVAQAQYDGTWLVRVSNSATGHSHAILEECTQKGIFEPVEIVWPAGV